MKQVVYVDVLLAVNLFVNYFLLLAAAKFLSLFVKRRRLLAGAALGAFYSLSIFLPELPGALSLLVKLLLSATIVLAAFGWRGTGPFLRALASFYIMNFAFAGFMLAVWYFISPQNILVKNSVVYLNISPLLLIVLTVVCYGVVRLVHRITGRQAPAMLDCEIKIERGGKTACCVARVDTGNSLVEPFSGSPVVVAQRDVIKDVAPPLKEGARLVPFTSVSGGGLLPAFQPDRLIIVTPKEKKEVKKVYIAVCETALSGGEFSALLNPALLS